MELRDAIEVFKARRNYKGWYDSLRVLYAEDRSSYPLIKEFRREATKEAHIDPSNMMRLVRDSYILTARDKFEDYMIAMEWNRKKKFYLPRRKALLPMVEVLQDLADDKLDIAGISMPPGTGKSGTGLLYCSWLGGRRPREGILLTSHNNSWLEGAYDELLREVRSDEYLWGEIFKGSKVVSTNAKDMKVAIDVEQRFPTFQFGSISSGLAGKVRAMQLLYCDDLIEGLEEALSIERLNAKWAKYTGDLLQRTQGDHCKQLHIATRWSVHDIVGRLEDMNKDNPRAKFLSIPALNEEGESNFDYPGGEGFSTQTYMAIKEALDDVTWRALYMNEPVEREGLVYREEELKTFMTLPSGEPDAILAVCDPAEGGGDDTVLLIFAVYGSEHYLIGGVCDDGLPEATSSLCALELKEKKAQRAQFESNSAGGGYADMVSRKLKEAGGRTSITKKRTTANKETKIIVRSAWVKENVYFPDASLRDKTMKDIVRKLCSYSHKGKNKHDDVPDAFAQYAMFVESLFYSTATVISRRKLGF